MKTLTKSAVISLLLASVLHSSTEPGGDSGMHSCGGVFVAAASLSQKSTVSLTNPKGLEDETLI